MGRAFRSSTALAIDLTKLAKVEMRLEALVSVVWGGGEGC